MTDRWCQRRLCFSYWTPLIDAVGNPGPVRRVSIHAIAASRSGRALPYSRDGLHAGGAEYCSLRWYGARPFHSPTAPAPGSTTADSKTGQRSQDAIRRQGGLKRADDCQQRQDTRAAFSQHRRWNRPTFYCMQWGVRTPSLPESNSIKKSTAFSSGGAAFLSSGRSADSSTFCTSTERR